MTVTDRNGVTWGVYPVVWCDRCDGDRPHHGPYCCSCGWDPDYPSGTDQEDEEAM